MVKLLKLQNLHGGSSGSFIFVTADKRYILKIISKEERDLMIKILPDYLERLTGYPQSYLVKIFGLFTILPENLNILLMENLLPDHENLVIFDLKGSYRNRIVFIDSFPIAGKVLKDQNFREAKIKIKCENNEIVEQLQEDFKMLSKHNIMDYSLIIGIPFKMVQSSRVIIISSDIRLGVIDILQKYNLKKIYEKNLKSIIHKSIEISAADPVTYLTRINRFLSKIFIQ